MPTDPPRVNRRKQVRMRLSVPVRVQGHLPDGEPWEEMSTTENADYGGAAFVLRRTVQVGHALHLSLPLPKALRMYDLTTPGYSVFALVRHAEPEPGGAMRVGVMFLGRNPPKGFESNLGGRFLLPGDAGALAGGRRERREWARYDVAIEVRIVRSQPVDYGPPLERTITRNLGVGGAMVPTSLPLSRGERVTFEDLEGVLHTQARVEAITIGPDNVPRLNLRFLDPSAADEARALLRRSGIS